MSAAALLLPGCGERAATPRLEPISYERWSAQIPSSHRGKVLVIPVWATWCRSCVELLPATAEIAQQYETQEVEVVSLCLDDVEDPPAVRTAEKLLQESGAAFPNYLLRSEISEALAQLDLAGLPAVLVYDPAGQLRYRLTGDSLSDEISSADIQDAIESLL